MTLVTAFDQRLSGQFCFSGLYRFLFPPRKMLLVCGDRPAFHLMEKINSREDKYYLANGNSYPGRNGCDHPGSDRNLMRLIIGDIPAKDRNALLKKCFER